jgi:hypothetical protein
MYNGATYELRKESYIIFRGSSAVEQSAVNRLVVGSNPTRGANKTYNNMTRIIALSPKKNTKKRPYKSPKRLAAKEALLAKKTVKKSK